MKDGFIRVAAATPDIHVADPQYNSEQIIELMEQGSTRGVKVMAFPELCLTAYTCSDLFLQESLLREAKKELKGIEITEADNINIELSDYNYYYKLTEDNLKDMGLSNIKLSDTDELYIVKYDIQNAKVEIYNTKGYEGKYSLTDIEQIEK